MILAITFLIQSCGIGYAVRGTVKKTITVENKVVPENFIEDDQTLLILLWSKNSYDKYVIKAFDKFYMGNKEYVTINQYRNEEKYEDLDKYPFVFSQGPGAIEQYEGGNYSYVFSGSRPFHIFDRKEKTFYRSILNSGFFFRVMEAYAMRLEYYRLN